MKRYVAGGLAGAILLAGAAFWLWWRPVGSAGQAAGLPPVVRSPEQTMQLLTNAAVRLRVFEFEFGDAWVEPGCQGAAVFLRTEQGPVWAWYDLQAQDITQQLSLTDVLASVQQQVAVEPDDLSWQPRPDGPGMRLRFPVGLTESSELVLLRLQTEECTILSGFLERTTNPDKPGQQTEITFTPQPEEDYTNQWQTDEKVPRLTEENDRVWRAIKQEMNITGGYGADTWIERRCNMAVVHVQPNGQSTEFWVVWDMETERVTETLTREHVVKLLAAEVPNLQIDPDHWVYRQDAPGTRPRYKVGDVGLDVAYLHLNTRNCSLQPLQLQVAWDAAEMGRFIPLPETHAAQ